MKVKINKSIRFLIETRYDNGEIKLESYNTDYKSITFLIKDRKNSGDRLLLLTKKMCDKGGREINFKDIVFKAKIDSNYDEIMLCDPSGTIKIGTTLKNKNFFKDCEIIKDNEHGSLQRLGFSSKIEKEIKNDSLQKLGSSDEIEKEIKIKKDTKMEKKNKFQRYCF